MASLCAATLARVDAHGVVLRVETAGNGQPPVWCCVAAVDAHVVRVCFADGDDAPTAPPPPRTPAVLPAASPPPAVHVEAAADGASVTLRTAALALHITLLPSLSLAWATPDGAVFAQDRLNRAYAFGSRVPSCLHACRRGVDDQYFGLGDKTGPLDLAGRHLRTHMTDALGRDPECVAARRCARRCAARVVLTRAYSPAA